jgi:hypothetical protein
MWIELVKQSWAVAPELFLVSAPLVILMGGFAVLQTRMPRYRRRQV